MEERMLRLLFNYAKIGKLADQEFYEELVDIMVEHKDISSYVNGIDLSYEVSEEFDSGVTAYYDIHSRKIYIYELPIWKQSKLIEKNPKYFSDFEKSIYKNIILAKNILHELEHANQRRIVISEDTLESHILRLSEFSLNNYEKRAYFKMDDEKQGIKYIRKLKAIKEKNYEENYKHCPKERLAEIKSHQEIVQVLSCMSEYTSNLIDYEKINIFRSMYNGYEDVFSPTIYYIEENGTPEVLNEFDWYTKKNDKTLELCKKKYGFDDRLKYGLPLDKKENKYCKKYLKKNSKYV